jgi:hypothetical protein
MHSFTYLAALSTYPPTLSLSLFFFPQVFVPLNNTDVIFSEIRDLSIEALGPFLQV